MWCYRWFRRLGAVIALATAIVATGCGGTSNRLDGVASQTTTTYVYAALENQMPGATGSIAQYQIGSNGTLTPLDPPVVVAPEYVPFVGGGPFAIDATGSYLFLAGFGNYGQISQYVIGLDGTISPNSQSYASNVMIAPTSISISSRGLAVVTNGPVLSSYSLSANGTLSLLDTETATNANSVLIDPSGRFLYADDQAYSEISVYAISSGGTLTLNGTVPSEYLPWSLVFSPKGILYSVDYGAGTITEYSVDSSTGLPTKVASFKTGVGPDSSLPQGMAFSPNGDNAFVTNEGQNSVTQFLVDATTGALIRNGQDIATSRGPSAIVVDPTGRYAYIGMLGDSEISQFIINGDGTLTSNGAVSGWVNPGNPNTLNWAVGFALAQK